MTTTFILCYILYILISSINNYVLSLGDDIMKQYLREPVNALTHLSGAVLSLIGTIILLTYTTLPLSPVTITSILIFGISLILLYTTSAVSYTHLTLPTSLRV